MKQSASKAASISRIAPPRMSAGERVMWREYEELREAKAPRGELLAWARRHKVKLRTRGRVELVREYRAPLVTAREKTCSDRCKTKSFQTTNIVNNQKVVTSCKLDGCFYNRDLKFWVCTYDCMAVARAIR